MTSGPGPKRHRNLPFFGLIQCRSAFSSPQFLPEPSRKGIFEAYRMEPWPLGHSVQDESDIDRIHRLAFSDIGESRIHFLQFLGNKVNMAAMQRQILRHMGNRSPFEVSCTLDAHIVAGGRH